MIINMLCHGLESLTWHVWYSRRCCVHVKINMWILSFILKTKVSNYNCFKHVKTFHHLSHTVSVRKIHAKKLNTKWLMANYTQIIGSNLLIGVKNCYGDCYFPKRFLWVSIYNVASELWLWRRAIKWIMHGEILRIHTSACFVDSFIQISGR